jgi:hypothetical protein
LDLFSFTALTTSLWIFTDLKSSAGCFFFTFMPQCYTNFHHIAKYFYFFILRIRLFVYFSEMSIENIRRIKEEAGKPKPTKIYRIPKVSKKRAAKIAEQKLSGTDSEMDLFFKANRSKMKGRCLFCNGDTMIKNSISV